MDEKTNKSGQAAEPAAEPDGIMQGIQDMIGDLLKNAVEKMQKTEINEKLGDAPSDADDKLKPQTQMGIAEVKSFIEVMQKFIDNVSVMISQLETGSKEPGGTDDNFLEGYMATADNVLEIAAFSMKDALTGLSNRYGFDNRLVLEWNRATRDKSNLGLVIFGVSGFGECEDNKGHDDLLKAVAETLENSIKRSTDFIARWSEDEFSALLPITNADGAMIVAERIQTEIGKVNLPGTLEKCGKSSVSIGVCVHTPEPDEKPGDFISKAYNAYARAKEADGDSIVIA